MSGPFIIYGEQMWTFTYTLVGRRYLHYDSESPLPRSYAREMKMYIHRKACMGMFIVARFIISLNVNNASVHQKQNGQISDGLSIQWNPTQQLKKNKLLIHETWVNLTDIKLCEWRQIFKKAHTDRTQFCSYEVPVEAKPTLVTEVRMAVVFVGSRHDAEQDGKERSFFFKQFN